MRVEGELLERGQRLAEVWIETGKANRVEATNGYYILDENLMKVISFYNECAFMSM